MPRYFDDDFLRRLRNDISWTFLLEQLRWPHKQRHGRRRTPITGQLLGLNKVWLDGLSGPRDPSQVSRGR